MAKVYYEKINKIDEVAEKLAKGEGKIKLVQPTISPDFAGAISKSGADAKKIADAITSVKVFALKEAIEKAGGGSIEVYATRSYKDKDGQDKVFEIKGKIYEKEPVQGENKRTIVFKNNEGFEYSGAIQRFTKEENEKNAGEISFKSLAVFFNEVRKFEDKVTGEEKKISNPLRNVDLLKLTPVKYLDLSKDHDKDLASKMIEASKITEGKLVLVEFTKTDEGVKIEASPAKKEKKEVEVEVQEVEAQEVEANAPDLDR